MMMKLDYFMFSSLALESMFICPVNLTSIPSYKFFVFIIITETCTFY